MIDRSMNSERKGCASPPAFFGHGLDRNCSLVCDGLTQWVIQYFIPSDTAFCHSNKQIMHMKDTPYEFRQKKQIPISIFWKEPARWQYRDRPSDKSSSGHAKSRIHFGTKRPAPCSRRNPRGCTWPPIPSFAQKYPCLSSRSLPT